MGRLSSWGLLGWERSLGLQVGVDERRLAHSASGHYLARVGGPIECHREKWYLASLPQVPGVLYDLPPSIRDSWNKNAGEDGVLA